MTSREPIPSHRRHCRSRSRSPYRERSHAHRRSLREDNASRDGKRIRSDIHEARRLPFNAPQLSSKHFARYRGLFSLYLDVQKQIDIEELEERELRGRWKSFTGKWNRGDLAEGWYDPDTKQKADQSASEMPVDTIPRRRPSPAIHRPTADESQAEDDGGGSEGDDFGPALLEQTNSSRQTGPVMPRAQDLELRDELREDDKVAMIADLRYERKLDRRAQKERLEELAPRADPGSRERQLEKKREVTATMKSFKDAKEAGDVEVRESDLMGDDSMETYKARKKEFERKRTERETRKDEMLRAREAEREERLAEHRAKEEKTLERLRALAKQRLGGS